MGGRKKKEVEKRGLGALGGGGGVERKGRDQSLMVTIQANGAMLKMCDSAMGY